MAVRADDDRLEADLALDSGCDLVEGQLGLDEDVGADRWAAATAADPAERLPEERLEDVVERAETGARAKPP